MNLHRDQIKRTLNCERDNYHWVSFVCVCARPAHVLASHYLQGLWLGKYAFHSVSVCKLTLPDKFFGEFYYQSSTPPLPAGPPYLMPICGAALSPRSYYMYIYVIAGHYTSPVLGSRNGSADDRLVRALTIDCCISICARMMMMIWEWNYMKNSADEERTIFSG